MAANARCSTLFQYRSPGKALRVHRCKQNENAKERDSRPHRGDKISGGGTERERERTNVYIYIRI